MKILLAVDDSPFSREATRMLMNQFRVQMSEVLVFSVVEPIGMYVSADAFPQFVPQVQDIEGERSKRATDLVTQVAEQLKEAGFETSELLDFGEPADKIVENATSWGADLIVVGSHGWKGINRFLLGSVSDAVARHAPCSVQIVRIPVGSDVAHKVG